MKHATVRFIILLMSACGLNTHAQSASSEDGPKPRLDATRAVPMIEFRLAQDEPADGFVEATIGDKDESIYLQDFASVTNEDVDRARVITTQANGADQPAIEIAFTEAGARKMTETTNNHIGKRLAVMVDGQVISAPTIRDKISTKAVISGNFSKEEAQRIADGISPPPFYAQLLLIKSDWSQVDDAAKIEAQIRDALKDGSVPQALLDQLPKSATRILFPPEIVSFYSHAQFAEWFAWLEGNGLINSIFPFGKPRANAFGYFPYFVEEVAAGEDDDRTFSSSFMTKPYELLDLPPLPEAASHLFISRRAEFRWDVGFAQSSKQGELVTIHRQLWINEQTRGQDVAIPKDCLDAIGLQFRPTGKSIAVTTAFPGKHDEALRDAANRNGFEALLVIYPGAYVKPVNVTKQHLHMPNQVRVIEVDQSVRYAFPTGTNLNVSGFPVAQGGQPPRNLRGSTTRTFPLKFANAHSLTSMLKQLFRDDIAMVAEERANMLMVRGTSTQIAEIQKLIELLDAEQEAASESVLSSDEQTFSYMFGFERGAGDAATPDSPEAPDQLRKRYQVSEQKTRETAARLRGLHSDSTDLSNTSFALAKILKEQLRRDVTRSFSARQQLHRAELIQLLKQLKDLEQTIEMRNRIKEQIIDRRVEDLLNPNLKWEIQFKNVSDRVARKTAAEANGSLAETVQSERAQREQQRSKLQGTWILARTRNDREPQTLTIDGNTWRFADAGGEVQSGTVSLDTFGEGRIVVEFGNDRALHRTWMGSYEIDDEFLVIRLDAVNASGGRSAFSRAAEEEQLWQWSGVYQRAKKEVPESVPSSGN